MITDNRFGYPRHSQKFILVLPAGASSTWKIAGISLDSTLEKHTASPWEEAAGTAIW